MVKLKITKRVDDIQTKEKLYPNDIIERSKDRSKDFISKGYAELIEEPKKKATKKK